MSDFLNILMKQLKKESGSFAQKFTTAAKSGADVAGKQILDAANNLNQPSDVLIEKIFTALKTGVNHAGQQLMTAGMDLVKGVSSQDETSNSSKSKDD